MDRQTEKLVAKIAANLPDMPSALMEYWIDNPQALQQALDAALIPEESRLWQERDGIIYLSVVSDGTAGYRWITRLERQGIHLGRHVTDILSSRAFKPTSGITTRIAILKGNRFTDGTRITETIRAEAARHNLITPSIEMACLIRERLSDVALKAMGLNWVITMHDPVRDSEGELALLSAVPSESCPWLETCCGDADSAWVGTEGFAFAVAPDRIAP